MSAGGAATGSDAGFTDTTPTRSTLSKKNQAKADKTFPKIEGINLGFVYV